MVAEVHNEESNQGAGCTTVLHTLMVYTRVPLPDPFSNNLVYIHTLMLYTHTHTHTTLQIP